MYSIETAKLSSKGQMVIPDTFRKRYGWVPGITLMLIGTGDSIVVQSMPQPDPSAIGKAVAEAKGVSSSVAERIRAAKTRLAAVKSLDISVPLGVEDGKNRRDALARKHG